MDNIDFTSNKSVLGAVLSAPEGYYADVVKIQRPLFTNDDPMALVYNADRSFQAFVAWDSDLKKMFGDDLKQYWVAYLPKDPEANPIQYLDKADDGVMQW